MRKLLYSAVIVVFFLLALSFYLKNPQSVTLKYYLDFELDISLSLLLWITLCLGVIFGWTAGLFRSLKLRHRLSRANRLQRKMEAFSAKEETREML